MRGYQITLRDDPQHLRLYTPSAADVRRHAGRLAEFYNDPHNRAMMGHSAEHTAEDVIALYTDPSPDTLRFLIEAEGRLLGDADLRHIEPARGTAEYAVMIGEPAAQGRGWGTQVSIMAAGLAFRELGLRRLYLSVGPANAAGRRCYEKVGYRLDPSAAAAARRDQPDDLVMSITPRALAIAHGGRLAAMMYGPWA